MKARAFNGTTCASDTGTYGEKLRQCDKEARITLVALVLCAVVWVVCGFGLAGVDVAVLGTPLWAVCGTLGTWVFAIVVAVTLSRRFFADFEVEEAAAQHGEVDCAQHMAESAGGCAGKIDESAGGCAGKIDEPAGGCAENVDGAGGVNE